MLRRAGAAHRCGGLRVRGSTVSLPLRLAAAGATLLLVLPSAAQARRNPVNSPLLWATINVCDSPKHPDTIGVRGSMPGTGSRGQRMYMRIRLDYFDSNALSWRPVGSAGDSHRFYVGASTHRVRQGGMSFAFDPPVLLRGRVTFEWRRGRRVIYSAEKLTEAGHTEVAQGDPPGFSAAECELK
jgi:hypothetical protein